MNAKEKIQQYIEYKGITVYRLESDLEMSKGYWSKTKSISAEVLLKFSRKYTDISAEWLLRGTGEMLIGEKQSQPTSAPQKFDAEIEIGKDGYFKFKIKK